MQRLLRIGLAGALCLGVAGAALAQGLGYDLGWHTVDGGGGTSSSGTYTLSGSLGQPEAGTLAGIGYTLEGGFWPGVSTVGAASEIKVYLPLTRR